MLTQSDAKAVYAAMQHKIRVEESGCHVWTGSHRGNGYGQIKYRQRNFACHRVAFAAVKGDIPSGASICHACDNRRCVNPNHLWLGDHVANMADMVAKGRSPNKKGERHHHAKLTERAIAYIRASSASQGQLAAEFGVHRQTIQDVLRGRTWQHVQFAAPKVTE